MGPFFPVAVAIGKTDTRLNRRFRWLATNVARSSPCNVSGSTALASALSKVKIRVGPISRLGDSPGFRDVTGAIAQTANPRIKL